MMVKMAKYFVDADQFLLDSFRLAKIIYDSGYKPDAIVGLWRGGAIPTFATDEIFRFNKTNVPCYPLKTEAYAGNHLNKKIKIFGIRDTLKKIEKGSKLLLVDDVFDTGSSLEKVVKRFSRKTRDIKIATIYYKPAKNKSRLIPDFYLQERNVWIVFPHELEGLELEEIKDKNEKIYDILTTLKLRN